MPKIRPLSTVSARHGSISETLIRPWTMQLRRRWKVTESRQFRLQTRSPADAVEVRDHLNTPRELEVLNGGSSSLLAAKKIFVRGRRIGARDGQPVSVTGVDDGWKLSVR